MLVRMRECIDVSGADVDALTAGLGFVLSSDLSRFFSEFNGAKPEANFFEYGECGDGGVNGFIPVSKILDECKYLNGIDRRIFPIAWAEGGNYVVIDIDRAQSVFFWDHENVEGMYFLADNIYDFIDSLRPFDEGGKLLREGQVESAWIDPDFLKSLQDK